MSAVPAAVTNALNTVQADSDALSAAQAQLSQANAAITAAQAQAAQAQTTITSAQKQLSADYQALLGVLASTYGPNATPPASPPPASPPASPPPAAAA